MNARIEHMGIDRPQGVIREAFLGERAANTTEADKVVRWARRINTALRPADAVAKKNGENMCGAVIKEITGGKYDSVNNILIARAAAVGDPNKERECEEMMVQTGQVVYLAIRDGNGGMPGIPDYVAAVLTGAGTNVDAILPDKLKCAGRDVVDCAFPDNEVRGVLEQVNQAAEDQLWEYTGVDLEAVQIGIDAINALKVSKGDPRRGQVKLALRYLGGLKRKAVLEARGGEGLDPKIVDSLGKIVEAVSGQERAESTYDIFVNAEYLQQPIQLQLDTFPPSWFRRPPERFLRKRENNSVGEWQRLIRARINLTNAAYVKAEVAALDGEKAKNNNWLKLSERDLRLVYQEPGVRESMERLMSDFFKQDSESTAFFLALKKTDVAGKPAKEAMASFVQYEDGLVRELMEKGMDLDNAKAAVAMAWNFLYVCNVFESADTEREISGGCGNIFGEQVRAMMHPLSKAKSKFGIKPDTDLGTPAQGTEEGWGGKLGAWFADMASWDDTRREFLPALQIGTLVPFPKRIGASMIELMDVDTEKLEPGGRRVVKERVSLAQALLEKREVRFGVTDANLFGDYGDKWDTFFKFYNFTVGKVPLDQKTLREWVTTLPDILAKVRGMTFDDGTNPKALKFAELDNANTMAWIIANSIGLKRDPRLMLDLPGGFDYEAYVDVILQSPRLVMDAEKRKEIKRLLHANWAQGPQRMAIANAASRRNSRRPSVT